MQKYLPKFFKPRGFTLVELLVVIAIIAILSVIGLTIFTGVQKNSRDARRRADIDSISQAMEANYGKTTGGLYDPIATTMFSAGAIPLDPINTNTTPDNTCPGVCKYCFRQGASALTPAACAQATLPNPVGPVAMTGGLANSYWIVCANLEAGGQYCKANTQ